MLHNHPKLEEARRLLNCAPTIESIDIADDDVRIIAGAYALRRLAEEAAERLIELLDELDDDPDLEPTMGYVAEGHLDECEPEEDFEAVNEDGGDILDEPHDPEEDFGCGEDEPAFGDYPRCNRPVADEALAELGRITGRMEQRQARQGASRELQVMGPDGEWYLAEAFNDDLRWRGHRPVAR